MKNLLVTILSLASLTSYAQTTLIENPVHTGTGLPFVSPLGKFWSNPSIPSDLDGICVSLGYESASGFTRAQGSAYSIAINKEGKEIAALTSSNVESVICNGQQVSRNISHFEIIQNPIHPSVGLKYSAPNTDSITTGMIRTIHSKSPSSELGICLSLGFDDAVPASSDYSTSNWNVEKVVSVADDGNIKEIVKTYTTQRIICIRH